MGHNKIRGGLTHGSALTKQCIIGSTSILLRKWQSGYVTGLKPVYGGSTPPFLVKCARVELEQKQALQMCGKEEGSREVIQCLLQ